MSMKLTKSSYQKLIEEDIEWLKKMPRTLERDHIIMILELSPTREYDDQNEIIYHRNLLQEKIHWAKSVNQDTLKTLCACDGLVTTSFKNNNIEHYDNHLSLVYRADDGRLYTKYSNRITCPECDVKIPRA